MPASLHWRRIEYSSLGSTQPCRVDNGTLIVFFEPFDIHLQTPNLLVKWRRHLLFSLRPPRFARGEKLRCILQQLPFPSRNLVRMNLEFRCQLAQRFDALDRINRYLSIESLRESSSLFSHFHASFHTILSTQVPLKPVVRKLGATAHQFPAVGSSNRLTWCFSSELILRDGLKNLMGEPQRKGLPSFRS